MQKKIYENYKYCMQDTGRVYVGCKYTFEELLEDDDIPFKLRMLVQRYILPEEGVSKEDTLETHLYYLETEGFLIKIYGQLKAKVKVNVLAEKRGMFGTTKKAHPSKRYVTKQLDLSALAAMSPTEKEAVGLVIQELSVSKLALYSM